MALYSLVGLLNEDGVTFRFRRVELPFGPIGAIALVRSMFRQLLSADESTLDLHRLPDEPSAEPGHPHRDVPPRISGDLLNTPPARQDKWLYLVNPCTEQLHVFEADADGGWQHHGTHDLRTA